MSGKPLPTNPKAVVIAAEYATCRSVPELAKRLGMTERTVRVYAGALGLRRDPKARRAQMSSAQMEPSIADQRVAWIPARQADAGVVRVALSCRLPLEQVWGGRDA